MSIQHGQGRAVCRKRSTVKNFELLEWTPGMVQTFWDYESQFPEKFFAYRFGREIVERLRPFLPPQGRVLDYGCGPGNLIARLLDSGLEVAGLDHSPATIAAVTKRFGGRPNFIGAFEPDGLDDQAGSFDAVLIIEVVEHLYDGQLDELLDNVNKLLKPGGSVVCTTRNEEVLEDSYILCPVSGKLFHRWQHVRSWSADSLSAYLANRGFQVQKSLTTDFAVTFNTSHRPHPLRERLTAVKKKLKYKLKPDKKRPHLVVAATTAVD